MVQRATTILPTSPEIYRFINADDAECLGAEGELLLYVGMRY